MNARMTAWTPLGLTVNTPYTLGNAGCQMLTLGADYRFRSHWHTQLNINYQHIVYQPSSADRFDIATITSVARQTSMNIGVGYSFG